MGKKLIRLPFTEILYEIPIWDYVSCDHHLPDRFRSLAKFEYSLTTSFSRLLSSPDIWHTSGFTSSSTPPTRCSDPVTSIWTGLSQRKCQIWCTI